ncbi:hypothetical protein AWB79_06050 [Caballeronia hypogeia]|uniref:Lipoprotein n=1 Tax=Caballeronia hypogeia TaxID=1777140 RepID=A0A158CVX0_9BURK|nr:hypothetical protein [Caballeronia hypogeia]SAK86320.1 hypothetical protein AWB79_06050 [Caballeronia hypogeia]
MNINARSTWFAVLGLAALSGVAMAGQRDELVNIHLSATSQNAGRVAVATLVPTSATTMQIVLFVSGLPSHVALPARLYSYIYAGTCEQLGPAPEFELNQHARVGDLVPMRMWKSVPVPMAQLRSGNYAVVLKTSPVDGFYNVFCGNLGGAGPSPA